MANPQPAASPYRPPQAPLERQTYVPSQGSGSFSVRVALDEAWELTWAHFGKWLLVGVIAFAAFLVSGMTLIGVPLVWPVLAFGLTVFFLNLYDGTADTSDLFAGFARYGNSLGRTLVVVGLIYLASAAFGVAFVWLRIKGLGVVDPIWGTAIDQVGTALFSVFFLARFYLALPFLVERELGPLQALEASWTATRGLGVKVGVLFLLNVLLLLAGGLLLLVGAVPAMTMGYCLWISAYRQIVGKPEPALS